MKTRLSGLLFFCRGHWSASDWSHADVASPLLLLFCLFFLTRPCLWSTVARQRVVCKNSRFKNRHRGRISSSSRYCKLVPAESVCWATGFPAKPRPPLGGVVSIGASFQRAYRLSLGNDGEKTVARLWYQLCNRFWFGSNVSSLLRSVLWTCGPAAGPSLCPGGEHCWDSGQSGREGGRRSRCLADGGAPPGGALNTKWPNSLTVGAVAG